MALAQCRNRTRSTPQGSRLRKAQQEPKYGAICVYPFPDYSGRPLCSSPVRERAVLVTASVQILLSLDRRQDEPPRSLL
jgi:hypothetical protein